MKCMSGEYSGLFHIPHESDCKGCKNFVKEDEVCKCTANPRKDGTYTNGDHNDCYEPAE